MLRNVRPEIQSCIKITEGTHEYRLSWLVVELIEMTIEKNIVQIIEYFGMKEDWDSWSEKFLVRGRCNSYCTLLISANQKEEVDKVLTK